MEKYAVDACDPVEERAAELEKTGMSIEDSRAEAEKEIRDEE